MPIHPLFRNVFPTVASRLAMVLCLIVTAAQWLKAIGLFSEIIAWKTRFFVPMTGEGPAILSRLMERHRLLNVASRH